MIEHRICADDRPARGLSLGGQNPIEGVIVMPRQKTCPDCMAGFDRQFGKALCVENFLPL